MLYPDDRSGRLEAPQRLVASTRAEFRRAALACLDAVLSAHGERIVVDLTLTNEIDASGLGVLVLLQKRAREAMVVTQLRHPPATVRQILALTRLDYLFELED